MEIALTALLALAALTAAYAARSRPAEAVAILFVSLPIVLWVPGNAPRWTTGLRWEYGQGPAEARGLAPPIVEHNRNLELADEALARIAPDETFAVVPQGRWKGRHARGRRIYLTSWLQFWLAPRIQVGPGKADWLIVLDGAAEPLPSGVAEVHRFGDDLLVQR